MRLDHEVWGQALVGAVVPAALDCVEARAGVGAAGLAAAPLAGDSGVPVGEEPVPA